MRPAPTELVLINRHLSDLNPLILGKEECEPGHRYGPEVREYTLIHFVTDGCGVFYHDGISYSVQAGEAFLIRPGEVTVYQASQ